MSHDPNTGTIVCDEQGCKEKIETELSNPAEARAKAKRMGWTVRPYGLDVCHLHRKSSNA